MYTTDHNKYDLLEKFKNYTHGTRVLFLIHRNKEGGGTNNTKLRKIVTRSKEEYGEKLVELLAEQHNAAIDGIPLRIYACVNARDINKAIREFKQQQLDADYYDEESRYNFYYDIKNRFISALMKPSSKAESNFLLDVDRQDITNVLDQIAEHAAAEKHTSEVKVLDIFKTKNGYHIITEPFNPAIVEGIENVSVNKDGLLLLSY